MIGVGARDGAADILFQRAVVLIKCIGTDLWLHQALSNPIRRISAYVAAIGPDNYFPATFLAFPRFAFGKRWGTKQFCPQHRASPFLCSDLPLYARSRSRCICRLPWPESRSESARTKYPRLCNAPRRYTGEAVRSEYECAAVRGRDSQRGSTASHPGHLFVYSF